MRLHAVSETLNQMSGDNPFAWLFAVLLVNIAVLCFLNKRK
ncbi:hypothetical protein ACWL86_004151 [Escherichia coli]|nr:hypothetical protein [Escherichia coli]